MDNQLINLFLLSWVVSGITETISEFIPQNKIIYLIANMLFSCSKCITFWLTLCITLNPYTAALLSFSMFIWKKFEDKYLKTRL